jgi:hypothetical protein
MRNRRGIEVKYIKIDESGTLAEGDADNYTTALDEVGPEGWNLIQLAPNLAAWVNDCGLILPEKYRRNPIGGLTIIALGASHIPYAGPIVLTGWDRSATARDEPEGVGLTPLQVAVICAVHAMLSGVVSDGGPMEGQWISDAGREYVIRIAHTISYGGIPPITIGPIR